MTKFFTLDEFLEELSVETIYLSKNHSEIKVYSNEVNRPGLQLAGYYPRFKPERVQLIGNAEWQYLKSLTAIDRRKKMLNFAEYPIPVIVFTSTNQIFDEVIEAAKKYDVTVVRTNDKTSKFINDFYNFALRKISPTTTIHGVLVEIYGIGVLIEGESGIGKSETALDLVTRGHRLVSDDVVIIKNINNELIGTSPEVTRHFLEIRGIGILDIERLYGVGSVKIDQEVELKIILENWNEEKHYDRVGLTENYSDLLGVKIPTITIPMKPGRNTAMIIEVAVRNMLQKSLGYNAAEELNKKLKARIEERQKTNETKIKQNIEPKIL